MRPRHRWENKIKMYPKEIGYEDVDWIHMGQDSVLWLFLGFLWFVIKCKTFLNQLIIYLLLKKGPCPSSSVVQSSSCMRFSLYRSYYRGARKLCNR
jgi:hypothetical protein